MPKHLATVTVKASFTYTVEIETTENTPRLSDVQTLATLPSALQKHTPEDFQVHKDYCEYEVDSEQLTAVCPSCRTEHPVSTWNTRLCHCPAIGTRADKFFPNGEPETIPHLIENGRCVPAPWWEDDPEYCRACGLKQEF